MAKSNVLELPEDIKATRADGIIPYAKEAPPPVVDALDPVEVEVDLDLMAQEFNKRDRLLELARMYRELTYEEMMEMCRGTGRPDMAENLIIWAKAYMNGQKIEAKPAESKPAAALRRA